VTERVTVSTRPVGFGLLFYAGIGLIAVAVIALAISKMKNAAPRTALPSTSAPVAAQAEYAISPAATTSTGKFCTNCGAALPARADFCKKCGLKQ
jgi:membrane protease subunit (stomatin/prohibitin family)